MQKTIDFDGTEVVVRETDDGYEAEERIDFETYLDEEVFTMGTYHYKTDTVTADVGVAEFDDGSGYVIPSDMERAFEDPNVVIVGIGDGRFLLDDNR